MANGSRPDEAGQRAGSVREVLPEILAPAGSEESLAAAVRAGADAVYLGGKGFNARRNAENFGDGGLARAVEYCHARGVKVYQTLNILVFDEELSQLEQALEESCQAGVDALIVQDLAVARLVRERAPSLPLHASTQMSVHDAGGARVLEELGFSRVVLARELSEAEIVAVREGSALEFECFVHGALCRSVSGQCYLSSVLGGRSGNRGLCAQPCRLPFSAGGRDHVLSLKDLSLIGSARRMGGQGIRALKIEGRMKRPEYVAAAVTACRQALAGEEPDYRALEAVFSRSGFTRGYYDGAVGPGMLGTRRKEDVQAAEPILRQLAGLYKAERQSVAVDFALTLRRGEPVELVAEDLDGNRALVSGPPPQDARTAPTDSAKAQAALSKTGGTPYRLEGFHSEIDEGVMVPASQLNALRREALDNLTKQREKGKSHLWEAASLPDYPARKVSGKPALRVRLSRANQLTERVIAAVKVNDITVPAEELAHLDQGLLRERANQLLVEIPPIVFEGHARLEESLELARKNGINRAVVGNLGGIELGRRQKFQLHGDYSLNITNSIACEEYNRLGLASLTASMEMEERRIGELGSAVPLGMLAYGYLPLMAMRGCPAGACDRCNRDFPEVTDRRGVHFFADCNWGVSRLHNSVPLYLGDQGDRLRVLDFLTLYFTKESPEECAEIIRLFQEGGVYPGKMTRGLYRRKVF